MPFADGVLFDPSVGDMVGFWVVGHGRQFVLHGLEGFPCLPLIAGEGGKECLSLVGEGDGGDGELDVHGLRPLRGQEPPRAVCGRSRQCAIGSDYFHYSYLKS